MKKIISLLVTLMMLVSLSQAVLAVETPVLSEGQTYEYFAKDYAIQDVFNYAAGYSSYNGCRQSGDSGVSIISGNVFFKFNSEKAQAAKIKIKWAPAAQTADRFMICFLNPCNTLRAAQYNDSMVEGVDYPAKSEAIINHQIQWNEFKSDVKDTGDWNEEVVSVTLKEGENTLWFPTGELSEFNYNDNNKVTSIKYTQPYLNDKNSSANANLLVYSMTVEIPEAKGSTVWVKDLEWTQTTADWYYSVEKKYNKSYMGDDPYGYTNCVVAGFIGECVIFPFNIVQNGDYILKVYYAEPRQDAVSYAAMYLDANPAYTDAAMSNGNMSTLWAKSMNGQTTEVADAISAFKSVGGNTISPILSGTWSFTGSAEFIDNGNQSAADPTSFYKAPYFKIKTFDLKNIKAGEHTASFLREMLDINGDGTDENLNRHLLINRIEIIPANNRAEVPVDINTNSYCYSDDKSLDQWIWAYTALDTVDQARQLYLNRTREYTAKDITFEAQFINNSDTAKTYKPFIASYDVSGKLVSVSAESDVSVPATPNAVITKKYTADIASLDESIKCMKLLVLGDDGITPAHTATVIEDSAE